MYIIYFLLSIFKWFIFCSHVYGILKVFGIVVNTCPYSSVQIFSFIFKKSRNGYNCISVLVFTIIIIRVDMPFKLNTYTLAVLRLGAVLVNEKYQTDLFLSDKYLNKQTKKKNFIRLFLS